MPFKVAFFSKAPNSWIAFPPVGHEGGRPLSYARAVDGLGIGKYGTHLGNNTSSCSYGSGQVEKYAPVGQYYQLYMNGQPPLEGSFQWLRLTASTVSDRPTTALRVEGSASVALVRAQLPNGDVHPGVWQQGQEPSFACGGSNYFMLSRNPLSATFDVLCFDETNAAEPTLGFSAIPPTPGHRLFQASGFERNDPLHHGLVFAQNTVGKYGPSLGTGCNYSTPNGKEDTAPSGSYHKLYCVGHADSWSWIKMRPADLKSLVPPPTAAKVQGLLPNACLVRVLVDRAASVHPGMWATGSPPFYVWGGQRRNVTSDTDPSKLMVEVLCLTTLVGTQSQASLGFRPRDVSLAFASKSNDSPISTVAELLAFTIPKDGDVTSVVRNSLLLPLLSVKDSPSNARPKLLVCHDFKGGYHDSDYGSFTYGDIVSDEVSAPDTGIIASAQSSRDDLALRDYYTFQYWHILDTFIYFAHNFVSVPTIEWTNACHKNHVRALGTLITEGREGMSETLKILASHESIIAVCDKLAALAKWRGFEGYLINIENQVPANAIPNLLLFVRELTARVKAAVPFGMVIWYDAVTVHGNLSYQNAVTEDNIDFALACDGIFTNYFWAPAWLKRTEATMQARGQLGRLRDVYCGNDVFGRSTYKGGGFQTKEAVAIILEATESIAIFAPGWSRESCAGGYKDFVEKDHRLWEELSLSVRASQIATLEHLQHTMPLFAGMVSPSSLLPIATLSSFPFSSSASTPCGSSYFIGGSGVASAGAKWCQQAAADSGFAFTTLPSPGTGSGQLAAIIINNGGLVKGTSIPISMADAVVRTSPVFQGNRSIELKRPVDATAWVVLVHGKAGLSADVVEGSNIPFTIVTYGKATDVNQLEVLLTFATADGTTVTAAADATNFSLSQRVATENGGPSSWVAHHGSGTIPLGAKALTGLLVRFASGAPPSVIMGRAAIGRPQPPAVPSLPSIPTSLNALIGVAFKLKRFEAGKAALLLTITEKVPSAMASFAVESHYRFEDGERMCSQGAFCGVFQLPPRAAGVSSAERVFELALPLDNLQHEARQGFAHLEVKVIPELVPSVGQGGYLDDLRSIFLAHEL